MMKKNQPIGFLLGIVVVILLGIFFWRQSERESLLKQYGDVVGLSDDYITYRSVQLPLFGNGLLFYKVQLKEVSFPISIEKMKVSVDKTQTQINLSGVSFNVSEALRILKADRLLESYKNYVPYQSIWTKPLETLALVGVEEVRLSAQLKIKNLGLERQITGEMMDKKLGKVVFDMVVPLNDPVITVRSLTAAPMVHGTFSWEDISLAPLYIKYAQSLGVKTPLNWMTGIIVR